MAEKNSFANPKLSNIALYPLHCQHRITTMGTHCEVYLIQPYVMKRGIASWQLGGLILRVLEFPPPIKIISHNIADNFWLVVELMNDLHILGNDEWITYIPGNDEWLTYTR